jgi:hypothetical protein
MDYGPIAPENSLFDSTNVRIIPTQTIIYPFP